MSCGPLIVLPIHLSLRLPRYPRSAASSGSVTAPTEPWYRSSVTCCPGAALLAFPQPASAATAARAATAAPARRSPRSRTGRSRHLAVVLGRVAFEDPAGRTVDADRHVAGHGHPGEPARQVAVVVRGVVLGDPVVEHDHVARRPLPAQDVLRPGHVRLQQPQDVA